MSIEAKFGGFAGPQAVRGLADATGAWVWDPGADLLFADARFAHLYGLDAAQAAAGLPTAAFFAPIHPDDRMRVRIGVAGLLHGADIFAKDYRVVDPGGSVRWVSARGQAEHDDNGNLVRFGGVLSDITEQKRVEEQLHIAQTAGGVGTFEYLEGFATASVSEQFCRVLGLQVASALPRRTINSVVHPDDPPLIRVLATEEPSRSAYTELRIRRANDGQERWIACRGERRIDRQGAGPRFIGVIYDITETKRAETQLRELAATLEQQVGERTLERDRVWKLSTDLFAVFGPDGLCRAANPAWTSGLGYSEAELRGQTFQDLVHPEDLAAAKACKAELAAGRSVRDVDLRICAKQGGFRWINWTLVAEDGAVYAIGRDITERRQLEEQLRQSQKMEAVGQLTGGLAHDLNNMLTGIMGGLDMVRRRIADGKTADAERFIQTAVTSAERAAALTHRLLAFSRRQSLDTRPVDVNELVRSIEDMLRRTLGEQLELAVVYSEKPGLALTDASQLESAILNLVINARDAMPAGGRLKVEITEARIDPGEAQRQGLQPGEYVVVSVSDTGMGMPQSVLDRAFDPFFTTKPLGQGTGLGLSMVYGFVRQTGGHVTIDSAPGQGATVRLFLRRPQGGSADLAQAQRRAAPRGSGETVLVVEDDDSVRMLVLEVLRELGYSALEAHGSEAALELLDTVGGIDLMITDVGLPGLNGRQLADIARERWPELRVLFITGYAAAAADRSEFLAPGMEIITKPFAMDTLARKIRQMIRP